jgi:HK97 family phage major capsid protein
MKRLKHLKEERARISAEMKAIMDKATAESRSRTAEEKTKWAELKRSLDEMAEEIRDLEAQEEIDARSTTPAATAPTAEAAARPTEAEQRAINAAINQVYPDMRSQIATWMTTNADAIKRYKAGQTRELPQFDLRAAASPMTPANTLANTVTIQPGIVPDFAPGFHDVRRLQPTFWDYIPKGRTSKSAYTWVNKKVPANSGAAAFIGPGVAKPGVSFTLEAEISNAKKIAASLKTSTELLDDIDGFETMIRTELTYQLKQKANTTLMTGALSSTVPAGIQTISVAYSLTGVETTDPNNFDVIRAVVAQLSVGFFAGLPVTVFVNPVDAANMDLTKSPSQGVYILPPFSTADGRRIAGAIVVEDNNVPSGYFQAACLDLYKILMYQDLTILFGWENDDFTKNLVTVIGEMRLHQFYSANDAGAFIYDTFANVKTLIEAA